MRVVIKWKHFAQEMYSHGSKVDFQKQIISFDNPLMPPSFEIKRWYSRTNFQAKRQTPTLPILNRGEKYRLIVNAESYPENSFYIRVVFFNRFGKQVGFKILKTKDATFAYPKDAYSYDIALLNAGCEKLEFQSMVLKSIDDMADLFTLSAEKQNPSSEAKVNLVFVEESDDLIYEKSMFSEVINRLGDVVFIADTDGELSMLNQETEKFILDLIHNQGEDGVNFFSYGPKGNFATRYYCEKLKQGQVFSSQEFYDASTYHTLLSHQGMSVNHVEELIKMGIGDHLNQLPNRDLAIVSSLVHPLRLLVQQFLEKDGHKK
ncbi:accessory Sec system protein Asp3 [Streptococcus suis]|nr:accessory Sec system protein Asp3 [Streptococcus suis]NQP17438.1 accessory Sec system protein Asp3 [Streptococcus suis]